MIVASVVEMMRGPPGLPGTMNSAPSRLTIVGLIEDSGRLPGAIAFLAPCTSPNMFGVPGRVVKSSISLLRKNPVSPAMTLAPNQPLMV